MDSACATIDPASAKPPFGGNNTVVPSFARLPKASTYCSAIRRLTASDPRSFLIESARMRTERAVASALRKMASASPEAELIRFCWSPSDCKIAARFLRSASATSSIAARTWLGGTISLIS